MYYLFLFLLAFPSFAFNDWRIECRGQLPNKIVTLSDERINQEMDTRFLRINVWDKLSKTQWSHEGRVYVENKNVRENVFFSEGRRSNYKLSYLEGFKKLPSEKDVDLNRANSLLQIIIHSNLNSDSPIFQKFEAKLSCYYRKGGE